MPAAKVSELGTAAMTLPAAPTVGAGIGLGALAFALFTLMDALIKWLSADYPIHQLVFSNSLFALVPVLLVSLRRGGFARLRTRRLRLHVLRGLLGAAGSLLAFYAYSRLPLADAYAIIFTTPVDDHRAVAAGARRAGRLAPLVGGRGRLRGRPDHAAAGGRADRRRRARRARRGLPVGAQHPSGAQARHDREHRQHRALQQPHRGADRRRAAAVRRGRARRPRPRSDGGRGPDRRHRAAGADRGLPAARPRPWWRRSSTARWCGRS